ncbi:MAG TPA: hypothetical protein VFI91_02555 [Longimicrobiaceae bacterium]|nr:hypothetical protein [Longimicrobiaceae bacterium]
MARHNREGKGEDQGGNEYVVSYQPDWLHQVKVTRELENGRHSTKTLFRNPDAPEAEPGSTVRTRIAAADLGIDFELTLKDRSRMIRSVTVETVGGPGAHGREFVSFSIARQR